MKRKTRFLFATGVVILGFCLSACQKTPEESVVADKSEGLPKGCIIGVNDETPKDLGIPEKWEEILEKEDGYVTLTADCEIQIPEIYNTPVYSYEMKHLTNERLRELCDYFAGDDSLYAELPMTKTELEMEKERVTNRSGRWVYYRYSTIDEIEEMIDQLIAEAQITKPAKEYVEAEFTKPYQTTLERYRETFGAVATKYSKYYYDTDEKIGFKARIDKGKTADPLVYAMNYNEDIGSTSDFLFSQGTFMDENMIAEKLRNAQLSQVGEEYENYLINMQDKMEQAEYGSFSEGRALAEGEKILNELGLEGYGVESICKAIGDGKTESWAEFESDENLKETGYSIYYSREIGNLIGYEQPLRKPYSELPETMYAPYFAVEQIHLLLTAEGIRRFEWNNISQKKETIAENTVILGFEEIREKLMNHLLYTAISTFGEDGKTMGVRFDYRVKNVQLRAANVTAFEDPYAVWFVPVWVFKLEHDMVSEQMGTEHLPDDYVVLNAIDGGYIRPQIDIRLEGIW